MQTTAQKLSSLTLTRAYDSMTGYYYKLHGPCLGWMFNNMPMGHTLTEAQAHLVQFKTDVESGKVKI